MVHLAGSFDSHDPHDGFGVVNGFMEHSERVSDHPWLTTGLELTQLCCLNKLQCLNGKTGIL